MDRRTAGRQWTGGVVGLVLLLAAIWASMAGADPAVLPRALHAATEPSPRGQELAARRTANSRTFADDHGLVRTRIYAQPVNFRNGQGHWQSIDNTLVTDGTGGARNRANSYVATLPPDLSGRVRFAAAGQFVDFGLAGAQGAGAVSGSTDHFAAVLPGVTADYTAQNTGLKETLTLADSHAQSSFRYSVRSSSGLTAQTNRLGGVEFVDNAGVVEFAMSPPFARDAAGATVSMALGLDTSGPSPVVTLSVDHAWLGDASRQFPVVVDPSMSHREDKGDTRSRESGADADCYLADGASANTNLCGGTTDKLGWDGTKNNRLLFRFDVQNSLPSNTTVLDAIFGLHQTAASTGSSVSAGAYQLTRSWTTGATWNKYDGTNAWTTPGGDFSATPTATQSLTAGTDNWYSWDVKAMAQAWINNGTANNGLLIKATTESSTNDVFTIDSSQSTNPSYPLPYMDVIYAPQTGQPGYYTNTMQQLSDRMSAGVNVASGNLFISNSDLHLPGVAGYDLNISHYFNGQWERSTQDLGTGWTTNLGPDIALRFEPDGTAIFDGPSGYEIPLSPNGSNIYTSPAAFDAILCKSTACGTLPTGVTYRLTENHSQDKYDFDSNGVLVDRQDRNANQISYSYSSGKLSQVTDTHGRATTITYTGGLISRITDSSGRYVQYGYTNGDLTSYTDAAGKTTSYDYSGATGDGDDVTKITDPKGNQTIITYDGTSASRVASIKRVTNTGTGAGYTWSYSYQSPSSPCGTGDYGKTVVTDPNSHTTTYCYDKQGKVTQAKDANGNATTAQYNATTGDSTSQTSPLGHASTATFDTTADSNQNTTHNLTQATAPAAGTTNGARGSWSGYGTSGFSKYQATSYTDPLGTATTMGYDTAGNLNSITNSASQMSASYNTNGTVSWTKDGNNNQSDYTYDSTTHDLNQIREPGGTCPPSPRLRCWSLGYDSLSRLTSETDGKGQQTTYTVNTMDRITTITYSDASTITYTYDDDGNVTQRVDNTGTSTYTFDPLNRTTAETYPGDGGSYSYTYDGPGNLTALTTPQGTTNYGYDAADRLTSLAEPSGSCTSTPTSRCSTFTYNNDDQRTQTAYPNGVTQTMSYDAADRLSEIKATKALTTLTDFTYDWICGGTTDKALRCASTATLNGGTTTNTAYSYDALGRLTSSNTGSGTDVYSYAHDNAGNLTSQTHNTSTTSYGYDASNELCWRIAGTQAGSSCTPPTGATTYSFDANGNQLSSSDGRSFAYNPRNQTTDLTPAGGYDRQATYAGPDQNEMTNLDGIHFGYDKLGMALRKNTTSGSVMYYTREPDGSIINEAAAGRRASNWPPRSTTTSSSFTTPDDVTAPSGCVHPPNTKPCTPTPTRPPDSRTSTPQKQG